MRGHTARRWFCLGRKRPRQVAPRRAASREPRNSRVVDRPVRAGHVDQVGREAEVAPVGNHPSKTRFVAANRRRSGCLALTYYGLGIAAPALAKDRTSTRSNRGREVLPIVNCTCIR